MYLNDILHRRLNLITLKGSITVTTCDAPLSHNTVGSTPSFRGPQRPHYWDFMDIYRACYLGHIQESDNGKSTSLALAGLCWNSEKICHKVTRGLRISGLAERWFPLQFNADWELLRFFKAAVRWKSRVSKKVGASRSTTMCPFFFFFFLYATIQKGAEMVAEVQEA